VTRTQDRDGGPPSEASPTGGRAMHGTVAVVTGAARGLGAETARQLAARGARVAVLGLEPDLLAAVAERCGPDAGWWPVDVTDEAALARVAAAVVERFGRVDVLVVNAGIAAGGPLVLADAASFDRVVEVNLLGSIRTLRAFLPALIASRGYALQIASLAALTPMPGMAAYCASKSGVEAFAHSVAAELDHHGVGLGIAYLSWIDTDMVRGADRVAALGEQRARLPFPFGLTYPVEPSVARLVDGIQRRSRHVYAQPWIRAVLVARGVVPFAVRRVAARRAALTERAIRDAADPRATLPVGPGGAADRDATSSGVQATTPPPSP